MGKRRNTAKTGDKAIYKGRENHLRRKANDDDDDDDNMFDKVDRFHNEREQEFIRDSDDEDLTGNKEAVLDLGLGGESSGSEEEDDSDDSSVDDNAKAPKNVNESDDSSDDSDSSDSDSDDEEIKDLKEKLATSEDPRKWGKKKSMYYHGDTADLEIGQEEEDAFLEEEAAKEIQKSRFEEMDEEDFVLSGDEGDEQEEASGKRTSNISELKMRTQRDASKLSKKEARKLLQKQHPELLPMVSYFADVVKELRDRTDVATKALLDGEDTAKSVGATPQGQQYLITKAILQKSIALNSVVYLLLKSTAQVDDEGNDSIQAHPVTDQIKSLYTALEKLEDTVQNKSAGIERQVDSLVKAAALLRGGALEDDEETASEDEANQEQEIDDEVMSEKSDAFEDNDRDNDDDDAGVTALAAMQQKRDYNRTLNEARFGLRPNVARVDALGSRKRQQTYMDDFGDLDEDKTQSDGGFLATTINSIEQRSQAASRKRRAAPMAEHLDDLDEDDRLAQGIKMMEEELGKLDDGEDGEMDHEDDNMNKEAMSDPDAGDESLGFYKTMASNSKSKKAFKKSLYQVAPKFPRSDGVVEGERAINRTILKNRGLVAHKAKINRNPRVKKREQYRKALIRRKGAVREVREGEGHKYGGEGTGIKSNISRSRKL